jgi:geranylgeranyl reductase family protein
VAGLGPGGAVAAHELGRAGLSVLAIDKKSFPRYKPCGGGLSARIHKLLSPDFQSTVERTIRGIRFYYPGKGDFTLHAHEPIAYMVTRERFDHFLVQKAKAMGVEIRENEAILNVEEDPDGVKVTTNAAQYLGKVMIGADGAHSLAARILNPKFSRRKILALEEEIPQERTQPDSGSPPDPPRAEDEVLIDLGSAPGGYAWSFPKAARLSVGVAGFTGQRGSLLHQFSTFKTRQRIGTSLSRKTLMGYPLPLFDPRQFKLASPRILLVGDAANLVDPFLGEGIYYAIRSSQIAADTVVKGLKQGSIDCTFYQARIHQEIYPEFRAAEKLARLSYAFPQLWYEAMRKYPEVTRWFYEILQGLESYPGFLSRLKSEVGRLIKNLFFRGL